MAGRRRSHDIALARSRFLGESIASARYVVGTNTRPVLDECSPAQESVRALLALLALNDIQDIQSGEKSLNQTSASALVSYSFTQSPRRNVLVIVSSSPDNIAQRLLRAHSGFRFVGEVWKSRRDDNVRRLYRLEHIPSGAVVISTSDTGPLHGDQCDASESSIRFARWNVDLPEESREQEVNEYIGKLGADARTLLAALFVRLNARGGRKWAVGEFWWDPLDRPALQRSAGRPSNHRRSLRETSAGWELRWDGPPLPSDVVAAFTHPVCGLRGAQAAGGDGECGCDIVYGATRLLLRPF